MNPEGYPAQPGGPAVVHSTTVNIVGDPPKDHIMWSLLSFVYMNSCCLGLVALLHSIKSRDRIMLGDLEGARQFGSSARNYNIAATALFCVIMLIFIISVSVNSGR